MRSNRQRRPAPKNEAMRAIEHARHLLGELQRCNTPNQKAAFAERFTDFLRVARSTTNYLGNESGRGAGLTRWVNKEVERFRDKDTRYRKLVELRNVADKDLRFVEPDRGEIRISVSDTLVQPGVTVKPAQVSAHYFLNEWPTEDIVAFCTEVLNTLEGFVRRAYDMFP